MVSIFLAAFGGFFKTHPESAIVVGEAPAEAIDIEAAVRANDTQPICIWAFLRVNIILTIKKD